MQLKHNLGSWQSIKDATEKATENVIQKIDPTTGETVNVIEKPWYKRPSTYAILAVGFLVGAQRKNFKMI